MAGRRVNFIGHHLFKTNMGNKSYSISHLMLTSHGLSDGSHYLMVDHGDHYTSISLRNLMCPIEPGSAAAALKT
jgi:hypothetical protein